MRVKQKNKITAPKQWKIGKKAVDHFEIRVVCDAVRLSLSFPARPSAVLMSHWSLPLQTSLWKWNSSVT